MLLKIDVKGAATIRSKVPEAVFIFLVPGSLEELAQRLAERQTETPEELQRRLVDAQAELADLRERWGTREFSDELLRTGNPSLYEREEDRELFANELRIGRAQRSRTRSTAPSSRRI